MSTPTAPGAPFTFEARSDRIPFQRLDLSPLTPDRLAGLSLADIGALPLSSGRDRYRAEELFAISGNDPSHVRIVGSLARFDRIGAGLSQGRVTVEGHVGAYLGQGMKGGAILVNGSAGIFAGAQMQGGSIDISGDAGDFLGAAIPGELRGMSGGQIRVLGHAGDRAGDCMRRGAILVEGRVGDYAGSRMLAGTLLALNGCGAHPGYAMRRGTIIVPGLDVLPPTFNDAGEQVLGIATLLFRSLKKLGGALDALPVAPTPVRRFVGDRAGSGQGEIWVVPLRP
jgi:formylmethanofuran dehydrogenase subunit C